MRASEGIHEAEIILLIIPGSGASGFGCWSSENFRAKDFEKGSVDGVIKEALRRGWGCLLTDPNNNLDERGRPRPNSSTPSLHVIACWDSVLAPSKAHVFVMAHSTGGEAAVALFGARPDARERILSFAFADSVHSKVPEDAADFVRSAGCNFVASRAPLGDPKPKPWIKNGLAKDGSAVKSAGTMEHLETPHTVTPAALAMFDAALAR